MSGIFNKLYIWFFVLFYYLSYPVNFVFANNDPANAKDLQSLIERIIQVSVGLAFMALTVVVIFGGFKFITSGGDEKSLSGARQTIIQAILGIAFLALAWIVLQLIESFTGTTVTNFCILWDGC
jgi:hypothetical protein